MLHTCVKDQSEKQISFFLVYLLKSFFWNTQLIFKQGYQKAKELMNTQLKLLLLLKTYRRKFCYPIWIYQYPIKNCKYPTSFTVYGKYLIQQKAYGNGFTDKWIWFCFLLSLPTNDFYLRNIFFQRDNTYLD